MKKHLLVVFSIIIITLLFGGTMCVVFHTDCNRLLSAGILGVAWLISLRLLFSIAYSQKRRGRIVIRKHSK